MRAFLVIYTLWFILFGCAEKLDNKGYWIPIKAQRNIEFKKEFKKELIRHGLNFDVTVIPEDDGKFYRDGQWCQFWKDGRKVRWE